MGWVPLRGGLQQREKERGRESVNDENQRRERKTEPRSEPRQTVGLAGSVIQAASLHFCLQTCTTAIHEWLRSEPVENHVEQTLNNANKFTLVRMNPIRHVPDSKFTRRYRPSQTDSIFIQNNLMTWIFWCFSYWTVRTHHMSYCPWDWVPFSFILIIASSRKCFRIFVHEETLLQG